MRELTVCYALINVKAQGGGRGGRGQTLWIVTFLERPVSNF